MPKKTFKENTEHLDRFFSGDDENETYETQSTRITQNTQTKRAAQPTEYYRLNLKLKKEYRDYLDNASWAARKSITQYLNDLIEADKAIKNM